MLPAAIKIILNIFFYLIYCIMFWFAWGFLYSYFSKQDVSNALATKIQIAVAVVVLLFTFIFRKYFYFSLKKWD